MVIHIQIKNRQRGNIQKKNTYQLGMQHREYLEVAKLAEVPHRLDFDTLGDKRANFRMTNEQTSEAAAEETNKNLCVYRVQRSNLAQRGTQEQLHGETENRRWSEREKQKERKKQTFEGGVRDREKQTFEGV